MWDVARSVPVRSGPVADSQDVVQHQHALWDGKVFPIRASVPTVEISRPIRTYPALYVGRSGPFALFLPYVPKDARQAIVRKVNISLRSRRIR
jgi:hypothetical protein